LNRIEEAYGNLYLVFDDFPDNWRVPYNLACYCSLLGEIEEAQDWFRKAIEIDTKAVQDAAIDDPDLEPRWKGLGITKWKRTG
jgi:hypothetical protein